MSLASRNSRAEDVIVLPVVIPELKFRDVEREIFGGHLVKGTHDAALQEGPETVDGLSVDRTDNVLTTRVIDRPHEIGGMQGAVGAELVGAKHRDLVGHRFGHKAPE